MLRHLQYDKVLVQARDASMQGLKSILGQFVMQSLQIRIGCPNFISISLLLWRQT